MPLDSTSSDDSDRQNVASSSSLSPGASLDRRAMKRERDKLRARERRKLESDDVRKSRREKCRIAQAERRCKETDEQRALRLATDRERAKRRRQEEDESRKNYRLEMNRIRTAIRRRGTVDNAADAIKIFSEDKEIKHLLQHPGYRIAQIDASDDPMCITIAVVDDNEPGLYLKATTFRRETDDQKAQRLEKGRQYAARRRTEETAEQRQLRLEREREGTRRRRAETRTRSRSSHSSAHSPKPTIPVPSELGAPSSEESIVDIIRLPDPVSVSIVDDADVDDYELKVDVESDALSPMLQPLSSSQQQQSSSDALGYFLNPVASSSGIQVPTLTSTEMPSLLEISHIYSQVLQPPQASEPTTSWAHPTQHVSDPTANKNQDLYLMSNLGFENCMSPMPPTGLLNSIPSGGLFHQQPEDAGQMTIDILLRNLSGPPPVGIDNSFNPNNFSTGLLQNPGRLGLQSHQSNMFGTLDGILGAGYGTAVVPTPLIMHPGQLSTVGGGRPPSRDTSTGPGGLSTADGFVEVVDDRGPTMVCPHADKIVQNAFNSLCLQLDATRQTLSEEGCLLDASPAKPCPLDMTITASCGLHLVVSAYIVRQESQRLCNSYFTSLHRLANTRNAMTSDELFGVSPEDARYWAEVYDTTRALHVELERILVEKAKTDVTDTSLFNAVEHVELLLKRAQRRGRPLGRKLTFVDLVVIEVIDFLDQVAQISWIVFPTLAQERAEIHSRPEFVAYRSSL